MKFIEQKPGRVDYFTEDGKFQLIEDHTAPVQSRYTMVARGLPPGISNMGSGATLKAAMENLKNNLTKSMDTVNDRYFAISAALEEENKRGDAVK